MEVESETVGERDRGRGNKRGSMQVGGGGGKCDSPCKSLSLWHHYISIHMGQSEWKTTL